MERLLEEIRITAPNQPPGTKAEIDADMVKTRVGELGKKTDLAKFIL